jgi:hypothetical protein
MRGLPESSRYHNAEVSMEGETELTSMEMGVTIPHPDVPLHTEPARSQAPATATPHSNTERVQFAQPWKISTAKVTGTIVRRRRRKKRRENKMLNQKQRLAVKLVMKL